MCMRPRMTSGSRCIHYIIKRALGKPIIKQTSTNLSLLFLSLDSGKLNRSCRLLWLTLSPSPAEFIQPSLYESRVTRPACVALGKPSAARLLWHWPQHSLNGSHVRKSQLTLPTPQPCETSHSQWGMATHKSQNGDLQIRSHVWDRKQSMACSGHHMSGVGE